MLATRFGYEAILYDKFHEAEFAVYDLGIKLPKLYGDQSDLIVPVLCPNYDVKKWTGWEWVHIYSLLTKADGHRVMPCRFDYATADGLSPAAGFIELDDKSPEEFVTLILERLALNEDKPKDFYLGLSPTAYADPTAARIKRQRTVTPSWRKLLQIKQLKWVFIILCVSVLAVSFSGVRWGSNSGPEKPPVTVDGGTSSGLNGGTTTTVVTPVIPLVVPIEKPDRPIDIRIVDSKTRGSTEMQTLDRVIAQRYPTQANPDLEPLDRNYKTILTRLALKKKPALVILHWHALREIEHEDGTKMNDTIAENEMMEAILRFSRDSNDTYYLIYSKSFVDLDTSNCIQLLQNAADRVEAKRIRNNEPKKLPTFKEVLPKIETMGWRLQNNADLGSVDDPVSNVIDKILARKMK